MIKTRAEIRNAIEQHSNKKKRSLRMKPNGDFYHDMNHKSPEDIYNEKKSIVKNKLKTIGLNDSEIDFLIDRK